jgi:hypothetical protein
MGLTLRSGYDGITTGASSLPMCVLAPFQMGLHQLQYLQHQGIVLLCRRLQVSRWLGLHEGRVTPVPQRVSFERFRV